MSKLSWKAKRKGDVYCAPACGHNCLWESYQMAKKEARKAADILGRGWKVRVWENMGWHWSVFNGPVSVYSGYWAMISSDIHNATYGSGAWSVDTVYRNDPRAAVAHAAIPMFRHMAKVKAVEKSVYNMLKGWNKKNESTIRITGHRRS